MSLKIEEGEKRPFKAIFLSSTCIQYNLQTRQKTMRLTNYSDQEYWAFSYRLHKCTRLQQIQFNKLMANHQVNNWDQRSLHFASMYMNKTQPLHLHSHLGKQNHSAERPPTKLQWETLNHSIFATTGKQSRSPGEFLQCCVFLERKQEL